MSATAFAVIGNVCKVLTILINVTIWDKHASNLGLGCLIICLVAATLYEQAPLRPDVGAMRPAAEAPLVDKTADEDNTEHLPTDGSTRQGKAGVYAHIERILARII